MLIWQRLVAVMLGVGLVAVALRCGEAEIKSIPPAANVPARSTLSEEPAPIAIADRETRRIHWIRSNGLNQATQAIPEERRIYLFTQTDVDRAIDEDGFRWAK